MVENYNIANCKYNYSKLKDVVYLFDEDHTKLVQDGALCSVEELSQTPLQLNVKNVELSEQSSLDERYKFDKTLTFSLNGFYDQSIFFHKYYAIVEDVNGIRWCVNVDFPSFVTYTFDIDSKTFQTNFNFHSQSNFPTMIFTGDFTYSVPDCIGYMAMGIKKFEMIDRISTELDVASGVVYTFGDVFKVVEPLKNSFRLNQTFDGTRVSDTISFDIPFTNNQWGWHYNLQQFLWNTYSAIITPISGNIRLYVGFNQGLEPTYSISKDDNTQKITINLVETSNVGLTASEYIDAENDDSTSWNNSSKVPKEKVVGSLDDAYECVDGGKAMYLLQEETYANGQPTGNYKVKEGYEHYFDDYDINIVGTFTEDLYFYSPDCASLRCNLITDIPSTLVFTTTTSLTYSIESDCNWTFTNIPNGITVSPTGGTGTGSVTITCTSIPSDGAQHTMYINVGDEYVKPITVRLVGDEEDRIRPLEVNVSCLEQGVYFTVPQFYQYSVVSLTNGAEDYYETNKLIIYIPANTSTANSITYTVTVSDNRGTYTLKIYQSKVYTSYVQLQSTMCENGDLYYEKELYTGTTMQTLQPTGMVVKGNLAESGSSRCDSMERRWVDNGNLICIDGDKWSLLEEEKLVNGVWTTTGDVRPKELLEEDAGYCQQTITYQWLLSDEWECGE